MPDEPIVSSSKQEEEYTEQTTPGGMQQVQTRTTQTPTHTAQEVTTMSGNVGNEVRRRTQTVVPAAAQVRGYAKKKRLFYWYQAIWYVLGLIEILLAFRFVLKLLGANPESGFANLVYGASGPFAQPFLTLFSPSTGRGAETTAVLEWSTLIAAFVYALVAWGLIKVLGLSRPVSQEEVETTVEQQ